MPARRVERLIGVYQADGGLIGELRYLAARAAGRGHCALCDVTHRGVRRKAEWTEFERTLSQPIELVHLNERSEAVRRASAGRTPCVLGCVGDELVVLLGPADLAACAGEVDVFAERLGRAALERGLRLAGAAPPTARGGSSENPTV